MEDFQHNSHTVCLQPELTTIGRSLRARPAPRQSSPTPGHPNTAHQTPCRPPPRGPHRARQATQLSRLATPPRHRENLQTHNPSWNPTLAGTINLYRAPSFLSPGRYDSCISSSFISSVWLSFKISILAPFHGSLSSSFSKYLLSFHLAFISVFFFSGAIEDCS